MPQSSFHSKFNTVFGNANVGLHAVKPDDAPHIYDVLRKYAEKLEINAPRLLVNHSPMMDAYAAYGTKPGTFDIVVSKGMLDKIGQKSLRDVPNELVKGLLGHEMAHIKYDTTSNKLNRLPLIIGPLLAVSAYYLLERAAGQKKEEPNKDVIDQKDLLVPPLVTASTDTPLIQQTKSSVLQRASRLAAAATGFTGGLHYERHHALKSEYRADKVGAMLMENPQGMIDLIKKLHEPYMLNVQYTMTHNQEDMPNYGKRLLNYLKSEWQQLVQYTIHAHPTGNERKLALMKEFNIASAITRHI